MKTAIDKNESELEKMKREALEWLERYGKTAPPFISVAVNAFNPVFQSEGEGEEEIHNNKNQDFYEEIEYMQGLYKKERYTQAEQLRDKLADKLDDIMRG
jgi:hypothetical protein